MRSVRYVGEARRDEIDLIMRVSRKWGHTAAVKLDNQLESAIQQISRQPLLFQVVVGRPQLRRCVVTPQTSIFFEVTDEEVVIKSVFDNRMNPDRLSDRE